MKWTAAQKERLFQYRLQQEEVFYNRNQFFLFAQSVLMVAFATILDEGKLALYRDTLLVLGLMFSILYQAVNHRQRKTYKHDTKIIQNALEEYPYIRQQRKEHAKSWYSSWWLMAYASPMLFLSAWIVFAWITYR